MFCSKSRLDIHNYYPNILPTQDIPAVFNVCVKVQLGQFRTIFIYSIYFNINYIIVGVNN